MPMKMALLLLPVSLCAQWLDFRTPGIPRTADGKPNLAAPAPKALDGKPDLSGVWRPEPNPYFYDVIQELKDEAIFRPAAEALFLKRVAEFRRDDPQTHCLPRAGEDARNGRLGRNPGFLRADGLDRGHEFAGDAGRAHQAGDLARATDQEGADSNCAGRPDRTQSRAIGAHPRRLPVQPGYAVPLRHRQEDRSGLAVRRYPVRLNKWILHRASHPLHRRASPSYCACGRTATLPEPYRTALRRPDPCPASFVARFAAPPTPNSSPR